MARWGKSRYTILAALLATVVISWNVAKGFMWQAAAPEDLIPQNTFLYTSFDGLSNAQEAYSETAEYQAFVESGLADVFDRIIEFMIARDESGNARQVREVAEDLIGQGYILAASLSSDPQDPMPSSRIIFNAGGRWAEAATNLLGQSLEREGVRLEVERINGRSVAHFIIPRSPGIQVGLWKEGESLVVAVGPNVVKQTMACISGDEPSLADNESFAAVKGKDVDFTQTGLFWLDWAALQKKYGSMPLPVPTEQQLTVADVLKLIGLNKLEAVVARTGYKGEANWTETEIVGLGRSEGPLMTLDDLPPLPSKMNWFMASQCDAVATYDALLALARNAAKVVGGPQQDQAEAMIDSLPDMLGFDPKADLLAHFGDVVCQYDDANGGMFGMGAALCVELKNPDQMKAFIDEQMSRLEQAEEDGEYFDWPVYPFRIEKDGQDLIVFDITGDGDQAVQYGAVQVVDNWLVVALMPQAVEAFRLRVEGKLPSWEPDEEYATALGKLPQEFSSISAMNTRDTYQLLLNLGMPFLPMLQSAALSEGLEGDEELPVYIEDFPPPELVTAPLFPNLAVSVCDENGCTMYSRSSTAGLPMFGGNAGMSTAAVAGVGVALLLPAVQAARQAARRTQSSNNLKQLGLAMHNYHDVYKHFPSATIPNEDLEPDERLSWVVSVLPFIEQAGVYELIDRKLGWNEDGNDDMAQIQIQTLLDPGMNEGDGEYGITHYVAIAGVGENAPELEIGQEGCGIFGYDRKTRMRDITDGTSNTMMITSASDDHGPWAQGGNSTVRGLTQQPYVYGPDGLGGSDGETMQVLMADGSVRTVSKHVDPVVMERLAQMADGQVLGDF